MKNKKLKNLQALGALPQTPYLKTFRAFRKMFPEKNLLPPTTHIDFYAGAIAENSAIIRNEADWILPRRIPYVVYAKRITD